MAERIAELIEARFRLPQERVSIILKRSLTVLAAGSFVLVATLIVAFDSIFVTFSNLLELEAGSIAPIDIVAPANTQPYVSELLTDNARVEAANAVQPIFDPPDPAVFRQQTQLAQQILDYVDNVRADPYGSLEQRIADLQAITALSLGDSAPDILAFSDDSWDGVETEIQNVLTLVMRREIQPNQIQRTQQQLSNQVSPRFTVRESDVIVAIVEDLIQPNTFENVEATETERQRATEAVDPQTRQLAGGQIIVREGEPIGALDYEALQLLNLLGEDDNRVIIIARAISASTLVMVIFGLYLARFSPHLLYGSSRMIVLLASLFLMMLAASRIPVLDGNFYIFPTASLGLLCVAIAGPHVGIIGMLGLATLAAMIANDSLLVASYIGVGGIVGILMLHRAERLNSFFVAGAVIGLFNVMVVIIFNLTGSGIADEIVFLQQVLFAFVNGLLLTPATALAVMYLVTMTFNLPTALKLIDLSQPNKPLLQRLLREAPGTYQHSLQVANLAEQAANAIGADAQLTHVAALYHDIGKMNNAVFFTENQQNQGNPHDTINDPYRSADYIISHVTEGDDLARQYRLPNRLRDFIREHHGTTSVYVFYQRALAAVDGDEAAVDISDFSYPGPRPSSKETAILMLADSCEAAVRSVKPESRQAITDLISKIIDDKRKAGQLDESGLTLNDLRAIQNIFVDILGSMFHPRINYKEAIKRKAPKSNPPAATPRTPSTPQKPVVEPKQSTNDANAHPASPPPPPKPKPESEAVSAESLKTKVLSRVSQEIEDEEPLTEVPRLPTLDERRATSAVRKIDLSDKPSRSSNDADESDNS